MAIVTSVWSSYGHRFLSTGECDERGDSYESCITCGAEYLLLSHECECGPEDECDGDCQRSGEYVNIAGDEPTQCTGDTRMAHGDGYCEVCSGDMEFPCGCKCKHCNHDCNCNPCVG